MSGLEEMAERQRAWGNDPTGWWSLMHVMRQEGEMITLGSWIQDHFGTLATAAEAARRTSAVNGGSDVAVVEQLVGVNLALSGTCWSPKKRLV